jgi:hypothetical protein
MRRIALLAIAIGFLMPLLASAPAQAQASRTWVSGVGDDANPCSRTAPCKTFAGAISKTAASGEINCLDSGGFGQVTIIKAMTLKCQGVVGSILAAVGNGVNINVPAATDRVVIEGLEFEGLNTATTGINVVASSLGQVDVRDVSIRHFATNGINLSGGVGSRLVVDNSFIVNNAGGGFNVGSGNTGIALRTTFDNNAAYAIQAQSGGSALFSGNKMFGSIAFTGGGSLTSFGDNAYNNPPGAAPTTITLK